MEANFPFDRIILSIEAQLNHHGTTPQHLPFQSSKTPSFSCFNEVQDRVQSYPPWKKHSPEIQWLEDDISFRSQPIFRGQMLDSGRVNLKWLAFQIYPSLPIGSMYYAYSLLESLFRYVGKYNISWTLGLMMNPDLCDLRGYQLRCTPTTNGGHEPQSRSGSVRCEWPFPPISPPWQNNPDYHNSLNMINLLWKRHIYMSTYPEWYMSWISKGYCLEQFTPISAKCRISMTGPLFRAGKSCRFSPAHSWVYVYTWAPIDYYKNTPKILSFERNLLYQTIDFVFTVLNG